MIRGLLPSLPMANPPPSRREAWYGAELKASLLTLQLSLFDNRKGRLSDNDGLIFCVYTP